MDWEEMTEEELEKFIQDLQRSSGLDPNTILMLLEKDMI